MSDAQLTLLLSALGALAAVIGTAIKWAVGRVVKSNDAGTSALIANTASNAVLSVKVDTLVASNGELGRKLDNISDWMESSSVGSAPTPRQPHRGNTPPQGVNSIKRSRTRGEEDDE